jgi:hypothetical protein
MTEPADQRQYGKFTLYVLCKMAQLMNDYRMRKLVIPFTAIALAMGFLTPSVSNSEVTSSTRVVKQGAHVQRSVKLLSLLNFMFASVQMPSHRGLQLVRR